MSTEGRSNVGKKAGASVEARGVISFPLRLYRSGGKRIVDATVALLGLLILSPLLILIATLVLILDGWPIFFLQKRVGLGSKPFTILKFRTMSCAPDSTSSQFRPGDRSDVTALGSALRKTKLDELPQLINVIFGDMAIVGPRPEVPAWTDIYVERWEHVLSIRPGITDAAAVYFRNEESVLAASASPKLTYQNDILPKKLDMYECYVDSYTLIGDINIFIKTLFGVEIFTFGYRINR